MNSLASPSHSRIARDQRILAGYRAGNTLPETLPRLFTDAQRCATIVVPWFHLEGGFLSMGKVYGVHVVKFKPGANIEEFEQFYRDRMASVRIPGMQSHLLRADRGSDVGTYVELFEFDSVETRDRLFPVADQVPPELEEQIGPLMEESARWIEPGRDVYTDWVTIV